MSTMPKEDPVHEVERRVERVMEDWVFDMSYRVRRGDMTAAQVAEGVNGWPDFDDAWRNWLVENNYNPDGIPYDEDEEQ